MLATGRMERNPDEVDSFPSPLDFSPEASGIRPASAGKAAWASSTSSMTST